MDCEWPSHPLQAGIMLDNNTQQGSACGNAYTKHLTSFGGPDCLLNVASTCCLKSLTSFNILLNVLFKTISSTKHNTNPSALTSGSEDKNVLSLLKPQFK